MKKLLTALASSLALALVPLGVASAWSYTVNGQGTCQPDGSFKIVWTLHNPESQTMTVRYSNRTVVPVGTTIASHADETFSETVDGTAAGSYNLTIKANWPGDQTLQQHSKTVSLRYACQQPSTITVHKTTSPAGDKTAFSVTISTEDGQVIGDATQSISDGGTVVYKVTHGTYNVTEAAVDGWTQTSNACKDIVVGDAQVESFTEDHQYPAPTNTDCAIVNTKNATPVTPPTGGKGGGQVLGATTQVVAPVGAVNGGEGAAAKATNFVALLGLAGSLGAIGYGIRRLSKSQN